MAHRQQPTQQTLSNYIDSHNAYVQQLHTTNAMLEWYNIETIPQLMQELEDIYTDLCGIVSEAIFNGADIISAKVIVKCADSWIDYGFLGFEEEEGEQRVATTCKMKVQCRLFIHKRG